MTHLIVELSDHQSWGQPAHMIGPNAPYIIPEARRPTMLQVDRKTAEREALRLATMHPGKVFVVFAPVCAGITAKVPTHVNINGDVVATRQVPAISEIGEPDDIPF